MDEQEILIILGGSLENLEGISSRVSRPEEKAAIAVMADLLLETTQLVMKDDEVSDELKAKVQNVVDGINRVKEAAIVSSRQHSPEGHGEGA